MQEEASNPSMMTRGGLHKQVRSSFCKLALNFELKKVKCCSFEIVKTLYLLILT